MNENIETKRGFVALIDVLGFRELIGRDNKEERLGRYIKVVRDVLQKSSSKLEYVLFSDTIVVNSTGDDTIEEQFENILVGCSNLFYELAKTQIAIRGAISYGPFVKSIASKQGVFVAGRPIVEAFHYEHQQDWVGMMLAPSTIHQLPNLEVRCQMPGLEAPMSEATYIGQHHVALHLRPLNGIPFHGDVSYDGYAVVPIVADMFRRDGYHDSLATSIRELSSMKAVAPDPAAQAKYAKTINWLSVLQQTYRSRMGG